MGTGHSQLSGEITGSAPSSAGCLSCLLSFVQVPSGPCHLPQCTQDTVRRPCSIFTVGAENIPTENLPPAKFTGNPVGSVSRGTERRRSPGSFWLRVCCELTGTRPASPASSLRLSVLIRKTHTCIVRRSLDYISHGLLALRLSNQEGWPIYDVKFFSVFATKL